VAKKSIRMIFPLKSGSENPTPLMSVKVKSGARVCPWDIPASTRTRVIMANGIRTKDERRILVMMDTVSPYLLNVYRKFGLHRGKCACSLLRLERKKNALVQSVFGC